MTSLIEWVEPMQCSQQLRGDVLCAGLTLSKTDTNGLCRPYLFGVLPRSTVLNMRVKDVQECVDHLLDQLWRINVAAKLSQYPAKMQRLLKAGRIVSGGAEFRWGQEGG